MWRQLLEMVHVLLHRPRSLKVPDAERLVAGAQLPPEVVRAAFEFAAERNVPLAGFLGDECVTLRMTPELEVR